MMPRITIMLGVEVPKAATSTSPSRMAGIAITVSAARIRISPIQPSRSAAVKPQATPRPIAIAVAAKASIIEVRPP